MLPAASYTLDAVINFGIAELGSWLANIDSAYRPYEICFRTHWYAIECLGEEFRNNPIEFRDIQFKATARLVMSSHKFALDNGPEVFIPMLRVFAKKNVRDALTHLFKKGIMLSVNVLEKEVNFKFINVKNLIPLFLKFFEIYYFFRHTHAKNDRWDFTMIGSFEQKNFTKTRTFWL